MSTPPRQSEQLHTQPPSPTTALIRRHKSPIHPREPQHRIIRQRAVNAHRRRRRQLLREDLDVPQREVQAAARRVALDDDGLRAVQVREPRVVPAGVGDAGAVAVGEGVDRAGPVHVVEVGHYDGGVVGASDCSDGLVGVRLRYEYGEGDVVDADVCP